MVEDSLTATAWGGPFTILAGWISIVVLSAFFAEGAMVVGRLFIARKIKAGWNRAGSLVLFLSVPPALVLAFSSVLGLRTVEPISNYSLMEFWPSVLCHFLLIFPIANVPPVHRAAPPPLPGESPSEYEH